MQYKILGKDLKVSAIGMGCMGISHAYGKPLTKKEGIYLIHKALDYGYNFFDTAEVYGPYINEEIVGEALKNHHGKVVIATKFGVKLEVGSTGMPIANAKSDIIRKSIEGSLKRLQVDCIDLYYQHRIDPKIAPEEVASLMADLIKEGKISHWGISQVDEIYLRRANAICPVTAIQNRYSMMARDYEKLFPVLEELNIGFVAFSPMANGFLSGKYDKNTKFTTDDYRSKMPQFKAENIDKNKDLINLLASIAEEKKATLAQISMAWMINKKPYIVPIPGTRKAERLQENAKTSEIKLSKQEVKYIDEVLAKINMSEIFLGTKHD